MLRRARRIRFVALLALAGCGTEQKWQAPDVGVSSEILAREISPDIVRGVLPEDIPEIPPPRCRPLICWTASLMLAVGGCR